MVVIIAILLTVVASTACSIGKALQKEATSNLPKFSLDNEKVIQQYRQSGTWLVGVALDVGGGIVQTVAFAMAPVSLLQPVSGIGLVGLALYSHFYLRENLRSEEWMAVGIATLGTVGLGSTSGGGVEQEEAQPGAIRMIFTLLAVGYGVVKMTGVRERYMKGQKGLSKVSAALYGLQAGGCFGLSASTIRTGFIMASSRRWTWAPFGLICGVALSSYGFVLQTCGLKEGSAVIVCTCVAVVAMVVGVVVGILGLGESMPSSPGSLIVRLCSWACIMYGVVVLSGGVKVVRELIAAGIGLIPARYWHHVPDGIAVKMKNWMNSVQHDQGLPEKHAAATHVARD